MKIHHTYIIAIDAGGKTLTYTSEILAIEDFFIKIRDKFGKIMYISKDHIIYFEEVEE
jgi:hypothetical protein